MIDAHCAAIHQFLGMALDAAEKAGIKHRGTDLRKPGDAVIYYTVTGDPKVHSAHFRVTVDGKVCK